MDKIQTISKNTLVTDYYNPYYHNIPTGGASNVRENVGGDFGVPIDYGQIGQGAMAGLSAGQAFGTPNNFQMNDAGVLGGVASGALGGASAGPVGAFVGGVTGGLTSFFKQDAALKQATNNVNTSFNGMTDAYGRPSYNGGEFAQGLQDLQGLQQAVRPGAHALRPRRRRQMMQKAGELYQGIHQGQQNYNQAESNYRNQNLAMQDYYDRVNHTNYRNLFSY